MVTSAIVLLVVVAVGSAVPVIRGMGRPSHESERSRSERLPWYASRGPAGIVILLLIVLVLLLVGFQIIVPSGHAPGVRGALVVRIAPFAVPGGDAKTGTVVADQLVQHLPGSLTAVVQVGRLAEVVTTPEAALAAARQKGAQVIIWGTVRDGATADEPALLPHLTWLPPADWVLGQGVGGLDWALGGDYPVARTPMNGLVILPPLLDSLARLQLGEVDQSGIDLERLRRDYGDVLNDELPATLRALTFSVEGLQSEAEPAARAAVAAAPSAATFNNLGVILRDADRNNDALAAFNEALGRDPDLVPALRNRGALLLHVKGASAALPDLQRGAAAGDLASAPLLASALRGNGQFLLAREYANRVLRTTPDDPRALTERAVLALTAVETATGRLEWELEGQPIRSAAELAQLNGQLGAVLKASHARSAALLQSATAAGAAGKPGAQRLYETQSRRFETQTLDAQYATMLVEIEQGQQSLAHLPSSISRFAGWLLGQRTPLQVAEATGNAITIPANDQQLAYDVAYQRGRARYLAGDRDGARQAWTAAAALTNTATLARQPDIPYGMAQLELDANKPARGRALLEQAITIAPAYVPARRALIRLAMAEQQWHDAELQLRWLADHAPDRAATLQLAAVLEAEGRLADAETVLLPVANTGDPEALTALGGLYRSSGQLDAAQRILQRVVELAPRFGAAYEEQARVAMARTPPDRTAAEAALALAIKVEPRRQGAHVLLGQVLAGDGQAAAAAREFQAATALNGKDPQLYRQLGDALLASGQLGPAGTTYRQALRLAPDDFQAHHGLAVVLLQQGRLDEAQAEEETTLKLTNNGWTLADVGLGDIARARGHYAEATAHYKTALSHDPRVAGAFLGLGETALAQNVPDVAITQFEQGLAANPANIDLLLGLGKAQLRLGNAVAAVGAFKQAQSLDPGRGAAYAGAGQALWQQGDTAGALAQLQAAVDRQPGDADSWLALAEINATAGQLQAALDDYARAEKARPDWDTPHFRRGVLLLEHEQPAVAVNELAAAVRLNDNFPQAHYWLGRAYRADHDLPNAERQIKRAIELDPKYFEARYFLGRVLVEGGRPAEARSVFQQLVKETPADNQWRIDAMRELAQSQAE